MDLKRLKGSPLLNVPWGDWRLGKSPVLPYVRHNPNRNRSRNRRRSRNPIRNRSCIRPRDRNRNRNCNRPITITFV